MQSPPSPDWVGRFAHQAKFTDREERAFAWAMHLLSRLTNQAVVTAISGIAPRPTPPLVLDVTAGFIPFPANAEEMVDLRKARLRNAARTKEVGETAYAFGIVVGVSPPHREPDELPSTSLSQMVDIDDFPVVVEYRRIIYNAAPHPSGARAACYAKPRASKRFFGPSWSAGIVIARHTLGGVGFSTGTSVPMSAGGSLAVVDIDASTTIDAAVLDCANLPISAASLPLAPAVAPGSVVSVQSAKGAFAAQVLRVHDHPHYFGNMVAHRHFLDTTGSTGDSGSLVDRSSGDATAIYMGSTGGSVPEGIAQSMRQVVQYFDIDLFN